MTAGKVKGHPTTEINLFTLPLEQKIAPPNTVSETLIESFDHAFNNSGASNAAERAEQPVSSKQQQPVSECVPTIEPTAPPLKDNKTVKKTANHSLNHQQDKPDGRENPECNPPGYEQTLSKATEIIKDDSQSRAQAAISEVSSVQKHRHFSEPEKKQQPSNSNPSHIENLESVTTTRGDWLPQNTETYMTGETKNDVSGIPESLHHSSKQKVKHGNHDTLYEHLQKQEPGSTKFRPEPLVKSRHKDDQSPLQAERETSTPLIQKPDKQHSFIEAHETIPRDIPGDLLLKRLHPPASTGPVEPELSSSPSTSVASTKLAELIQLVGTIRTSIPAMTDHTEVHITLKETLWQGTTIQLKRSGDQLQIQISTTQENAEIFASHKTMLLHQLSDNSSNIRPYITLFITDDDLPDGHSRQQYVTDQDEDEL